MKYYLINLNYYKTCIDLLRLTQSEIRYQLYILLQCASIIGYAIKCIKLKRREGSRDLYCLGVLI